MRTKRAVYSTLTSLVLQVTTIVCGFILPRLIIGTFGSATNGLIVSVSQFLGYIALMESGIGAVTMTALYKPLATKDIHEVSAIVRAAEIFFKKIAVLFLFYAVILATFFQLISNTEFDFLFTFSIVMIIASGIFARYYFGVTYSLLLQAEQKKYIVFNINIVTLILNVIFCTTFIHFGFGIHAVKLMSMSVFLLRPIFLNWYVKRHLNIRKDVKPNNGALKQRWDGLGHHIAYFLQTNTDVMVLTFFAGLKEVSIYSVYLLVANGMRQIIKAFSGGIGAAFGNIIAKEEKKILQKNFNLYELTIHTLIVTLLAVAIILINPFIELYTVNMTDVNYVQPLFGFMLLLAVAIYCIRLPYSTIIFASGHFKQTKRAAYIEAFLNVILSIIFIQFWGIIGIALATVIANTYRVIDLAYYASKNMIYRSMGSFIKRQFVSASNLLFIVLTIRWLSLSLYFNSYLVFFTTAFVILIISGIMTLVFSMIFYGEMLRMLLKKFKLLKN